MTVKTIPLPDDVKPMLEDYASFGRSRLAYFALWFSVWAAGLGGVLGFLVYWIFQPCRGCSLRPDPGYWPVGVAVAVALAAPILFIVAQVLPDMWAGRQKRALDAQSVLVEGLAEAFEIEIGEQFLVVQVGADEPNGELDDVLIITPLDTLRTIVLSLENVNKPEPHDLDQAMVRSWRGVVLPDLRFLWDVELSGGPLPRQTVLRDEGFGVLDVLDDPGFEHAPGWVIAKPFDEVAAAVEKTLIREQAVAASV